MLLRALGISTQEPCFGFLSLVGFIVPLVNYVAFFMLKFVMVLSSFSSRSPYTHLCCEKSSNFFGVGNFRRFVITTLLWALKPCSLGPHDFPRSFPAILLTLGCLSVGVLSYFLNLPLASAYEEKRFVRARIYSNWAIIADILAIILITIGLAIILSHPRGMSPIGLSLAIIGNTMFYLSYVPIVSGRYALFKFESQQHADKQEGESASSGAVPADDARVVNSSSETSSLI